MDFVKESQLCNQKFLLVSPYGLNSACLNVNRLTKSTDIISKGTDTNRTLKVVLGPNILKMASSKEP